MRRILCLGLALLLQACNPAPTFHSTDLSEADYARDFRLRDPQGQIRTLADFRGKAVVLFFGYTQCPDVCPTTLADMASAIHQLGADGERVQVLFVTLDPERDTPALLAQYVPAFDPSFLGLTGSAEEIAETARNFRIFYEKQPGSSPEHYTINHSAGSYVYDPEGRLRLYFRYGEKPATMASDLELLLAGK